MELKEKIEPPYMNKWGTKPAKDHVRCKGITNKNTQCRRVASSGSEFCDAHNKDK